MLVRSKYSMHIHTWKWRAMLHFININFISMFFLNIVNALFCVNAHSWFIFFCCFCWSFLSGSAMSTISSSNTRSWIFTIHTLQFPMLFAFTLLGLIIWSKLLWPPMDWTTFRFSTIYSYYSFCPHIGLCRIYKLSRDPHCFQRTS